MVTSTIHVLIVVPVFFAIMKERGAKGNVDSNKLVRVEVAEEG